MQSLWDQPGRKKWFGSGFDAPGIHSICVDPRNAARVAVGVSCGGVWVSENTGDSWTCSKSMRASYMPPDREYEPYIQDPHRLVQCAGQPDHCWIQHHNGVFRSTDGAVSWSEIHDVTPSTFGFTVAVHPHDPDTAWLVPGLSDEHRVPVGGRVVATRTRDGGRSFELLEKGLPQHHAYDLTYRHALAVDDTGDALAFGTTTGSLWTSNDQGNTWQCVSEHLPPGLQRANGLGGNAS